MNIKDVLRSFEYVSDLKVNFSKSSLFGVNVSRSFLDLGKDILHYKVDSLPFTFLGLFVCVNPKKEGT